MLLRFLLALLLFGAVTAQAADASRVERFMDVSGLTRAVANVPLSVVAGLLDGAPTKIAPADAEAIARRHFDTDALHRRIAGRLAGELTDAEIDALLQFADSPFGLRLTALESTVQAGQPGLDAMIAATRPLFADPARVQLTRRLDAASGLTDFAVATNLGAIAGALMQQGRIPSDPEGFRQAAEAIDKQFRPTFETQLQQQLMFSLLYTYRSLTTEELGQYVAFLETPAPRHATAITLECLREDILKSVPPLVEALLRNAAGAPPR